jgi:hypothetical protein
LDSNAGALFWLFLELKTFKNQRVVIAGTLQRRLMKNGKEFYGGGDALLFFLMLPMPPIALIHYRQHKNSTMKIDIFVGTRFIRLFHEKGAFTKNG